MPVRYLLLAPSNKYRKYLTLVPSYGEQNQNRRPRGFNKGRSSKFRVGSRVRQTPEEGRRTYRPKRCGNNYKDDDNSPKTLNDKKVFVIYTFFPRYIYIYIYKCTYLVAATYS